MNTDLLIVLGIIVLWMTTTVIIGKYRLCRTECRCEPN
jgi:hypothetical protein